MTPPAGGAGRFAGPVGVVGGTPDLEPLLAALESAFGVRFERGSADAVAGLGAAVHLDGVPATAPSERREYAVAAGDAEARPGEPRVKLGESGALDPRLRGLELDDEDAAAAAGLAVADGAEALATAGDRVLWARQGARHTVAVGPRALEPDAALRELVAPGRWLSLLPLVHFLRELTAPGAWRPPPPRATFMVDDPNLHRPRYGYISYEEVVAHADEHGYHVAFAMVPLDAWRAHAGAARLFRERADRLSLVFHGNDHLKRELARERDEVETLAMLGQAQRRMDAFQRRSGVPVARVMTPPHGACSRASMLELPRAGFEAACVSRPYPWLDRAPAGPPLAGWEAATLVAAGTAVVPRIPIAEAVDAIPLRAFLDQPLVVYGHHEDLAGGLDRLGELAGRVNALGDVSWQGMTGICRSNYATRDVDGELEVRLLSRRVELDVPAGAAAVRAAVPAPAERPQWGEVAVGGKRRELHEADAAWRADAVPVTGGQRVEVSIPHPSPLDPAAAPRRRTGAWPIARRVLVEARDRTAPLLKRA
jgi:hypothetical protein